MKSLERARQKARELRESFGPEPQDLLTQIINHFKVREIYIEEVEPRVIDKHEARLQNDGNLFYNVRLDKKPRRKLFVFAHELGHYTLEHQFTNYTNGYSLGIGTDYANSGAGAVARYHARSLEEAEADAFAAEFLAPSLDIFNQWMNNPELTPQIIADQIGIDIDVVRIQLAQGLYRHIYGEQEEKETKKQPVELKKNIDLNKQTAAAGHEGSSALVDAGPGTGKTSTLVKRVEYLLNEKGAEPEKMLILTFSNEAAATLRERITKKAGAEKAEKIEINTFHGFGYSFLLEKGLDIDPDITILDDSAQIEELQRVIAVADCELIVTLWDLEETAYKLAKHISYLKQREITPEIFLKKITDWESRDKKAKKTQKAARDVFRVYNLYEKRLPKIPAVDFCDLINKPVELLSDEKDAGKLSSLLAAVRQEYRWIMVDEYQDITPSVTKLLKLIAGPDNPPWVVGDTRQSIYQFLGADRENIKQFIADFPDTEPFNLENNFRSSDAIVAAANQMATLMDNPEHEKGRKEIQYWQAAILMESFGAMPVRISAAETERDETSEIVGQVKEWIEAGISPEDIAVLARRNVDVKNIALALGRQNIKATVTGILTVDGVAGDLAAAEAFIDAPQATLARIIKILAGEEPNQQLLDEIIKSLLSELQQGNEFPHACENIRPRFPSATALIEKTETFYMALAKERHRADGFNSICLFLFDKSNYLRSILGWKDATARNLALSEIVTVLTRAMTYRFGHVHTRPRISRIGFSERLRAELSGTATGKTLVPPTVSDSVSVMTCHASKGLEFPFVVVSGQYYKDDDYEWWLPPDVRPSPENDRSQAESLLFVGITRAQRAVLVTYSTSKNAKPGNSSRQAVPLLQKWRSVFDVPFTQVPRGAEATDFIAGPQHQIDVWGGDLRDGKALRASSLSQDNCPLRTYLEDFVGVQFPSSLKQLYPFFYESVRFTLGETVRRAHSNENAFTPDECAEMFSKAFSREFTISTPLFPLYLKTGIRMVKKFAENYRPVPKAARFFDFKFIDPEILKAESAIDQMTVQTDLVTHYENESGIQLAMIFRPESLAEPNDEKYPATISWSAIKNNSHKMSLLLIKKGTRVLVPQVFSGADGQIYSLRWHQSPETTDLDTSGAFARLNDYSLRKFEWHINEWQCERCPCRISCPHWMNPARKK